MKNHIVSVCNSFPVFISIVDVRAENKEKINPMVSSPGKQSGGH